MRIVEARLAKRVTANGLWEIWEDVPLGKVYHVDLDSRRVARFFNVPKQVEHDTEIVDDVQGGVLPTELLTMEE